MRCTLLATTVIVGLLSSLARCADKPESDSRKLADLENTFSVNASNNWYRVDRNTGGDGDVLAIKTTGGAHLSSIRFSKYAETGNADQVDRMVKSVVDFAKQDFPDLNTDCPVTSTQLDGETAQLVKHRFKAFHVSSYVLMHNRKLYVIEIVCRDNA